MTHAENAPLPITVLMPTFNRAHYLAEALDSVLGQVPPPAEVIIIDDGSDDRTSEVAAAYAARGVAYVRQDNAGKATALNNGLGRATQDFVWIFDDDDIAAPGTLAALHQALVDDPDAGYAYGLCDKFFGEWPNDARERNTAYASGERSALYVRLMEDFFIWQGAMLARRSCYAVTGPFDTRLARSQDYEMALRLGRNFNGVGVPIIAFHQRHHAGVRGPKGATVKAHEVEQAWRKYNHLIFRELHQSHALPEFYIGSPEGKELSPRQMLTALIQRGSIMARKGLWDLASADFEQAGRDARALLVVDLCEQEKAALRRIFQRGARSIFQDRSEARRFFGAISGFPGPLRSQIEGNMLLPVTYRMRRLSAVTDRKFEIGQLGLMARHLFKGSALRPYLEARRTDRGMFGVEPLLAAV
ncbi:MAG: glycosyltransferase family 2 protein [Pseudomonadota bacterium]